MEAHRGPYAEDSSLLKVPSRVSLYDSGGRVEYGVGLYCGAMILRGNDFPN